MSQVFPLQGSFTVYNSVEKKFIQEGYWEPSEIAIYCIDGCLSCPVLYEEVCYH